MPQNSSILKYEQFSCELTCCLQKLLLAEFTQRFRQFCVFFPHCFERFLYGTSAVLDSVKLFGFAIYVNKVLREFRIHAIVQCTEGKHIFLQYIKALHAFRKHIRPNISVQT